MLANFSLSPLSSSLSSHHKLILITIHFSLITIIILTINVSLPSLKSTFCFHHHHHNQMFSCHQHNQLYHVTILIWTIYNKPLWTKTNKKVPFFPFFCERMPRYLVNKAIKFYWHETSLSYAHVKQTTTKRKKKRGRYGRIFIHKVTTLDIF